MRLRKEEIMPKKSKAERIGILTSGGDCPGLNAAIRAIAKAAIGVYGMKVVGILEGFRGLVKDKTIRIDEQVVSGILTHGGTILGTSRDKPHRMPVGGKLVDMMDQAVATVRRNRLDCLVCLGGGGTQKVAFRLAKAGVRVVTLPKTIDNDVAETDASFGFDTAMNIATEAIDRLHTTATSHHRVIVCEIMGHRAGWLTLGAGIAGGADVILIPEIPYDLKAVADYLRDRRKKGKRFSIIAVAEGARSREEIKAEKRAAERLAAAVEKGKSQGARKKGDPQKAGAAQPEDLWKSSSGSTTK
jgi:6-phosphofructokinase